MKIQRHLLALACLSLLTANPAAADCCGPPPAPQEQFQLGRGWSGSVIYEHMDMNQLRRGSDKVTPDQVLNERLDAGAGAYAIPTRMYMDRASLQLRYQFDDNHSLRVTLPYRINQMDMRMASKPRAGGGGGAHAHHQMGGDMGGGDMGMHDPDAGMGEHGGGNGDPHGQGAGNAMGAGPSYMDMTMDQVDGLGDVNLTYNYSFDLDGHGAWVGAGLALPSGRWDVRGSDGGLIHNMMQPGSGAVGLIAEAGADIHFGDSPFSFHPRGGVLWSGTNPLGYKRGTRVDYELGTRYKVADSVGLSLDLVGFIQGMDSTNGTIDPISGQVAFQNPELSLADDVNNTGGEFLFLAPGIRVNPSENIFLGFQYRLPIYQNVRGTQLGIDRWYRAFLSAKF